MIEIQRAADNADTPDDAQLQQWAAAALAAAPGAARGSMPRTGHITVRLADSAEMTQLNSDFRGKNGPTNVLSFPFEAPAGLPAEALEPILGDIVICADVVSAEAQQQGKTARAHWAHMIVHGVLHLCGHDHQNDADAARMEALETDILGAAGFADPYQTEEA